MTVQALIKKSVDELVEWYHKSSTDLAEGEAKAMEAMKHDSEHWYAVYQAHETMFRDALDIKYKLAVIKLAEIRSSNTKVNQDE